MYTHNHATLQGKKIAARDVLPKPCMQLAIIYKKILFILRGRTWLLLGIPPVISHRACGRCPLLVINNFFYIQTQGRSGVVPATSLTLVTY